MTERKEKITEYMKRLNFHLDTKLKIIEAGGSEVFKNWQKYGLITKEEFIEAITWLCEDPLNEFGELSRRIGLDVTQDMENKVIEEQNPRFNFGYDENKLKGRIVKLRQVYDEKGKFVGFYKIEDDRLWEGSGRHKITIDPMSRI